jgi:hypothetical protein
MVAVLATAVAAGCGGGDDEQRAAKPGATPAPKPAASPEQFAERFERLTSLELDPVPDTFGTRMDEPDDDLLGYRFSGYQYYWTESQDDRDILLDGRPDADGVRWERVGDGWSAAKAYGPLILDWVGGESKGTSPEWERLDRVTEAAYTGRNDVLLPEERPCRSAGINPLRGRPGTCSVDGIPVTAVNGGDALRTDAIEARVLGIVAAQGVKAPGLSLPPDLAAGDYVVAAYRLRNAGEKPIRYVRTALRIGDQTFEEDAGATTYLPRSAIFPIEPGRELEQWVAFDVPPELARRARNEGALVLPAATDELGDPNIAFAQGWIRLADAPTTLPSPPAPEQPAPEQNAPPVPQGPPDIAFERGDGPPIGGSARRLYMANTFFPVPESFVEGGVPIGSRAGECRVPAIGRRIRTMLLATIKRETPRAKGRPGGLKDRQILLADCGPAGVWAMLTWNARGPKGPTLFVDEFELRGARWHGSPKGRWPGCGIPEAAAAAWQIDVSTCRGRRGAPPGDVS